MQPDVAAVNRALAGLQAAIDVEEAPIGVVLRCAQKDASAVLKHLRDGELDCCMLIDLFGLDTGEKVEITYHLRSLSRDEDMYVRCGVDYDGNMHSVWNIYPSALLPEREAAEMFGLTLSGHPNPKRLLTTDGVPPLLRKAVPVRSAEEVRSG